MSLLSKINEEIKIAMKSKDTLKLESLRAIKTAIILYQTSKGGVIIQAMRRKLKYYSV